MITEKEVYLIAETAYSHEGDQEYLKKIVNEIENSEIDAIKFQILLDKNDFFSKYHASYKKIDEWSFNEKYWFDLLKEVKEKGKDCIITTLDKKTIELLSKNHDLFCGIEVHPSCLIDKILIEKACVVCEKFDKVLFIGISGHNLEEIDEVKQIIDKYKIKEVIFVYGFQNFPTKISEIELNKIKLLSEITRYKIAYADHTQYDSDDKILMIATSFLLGAKIQEIHCVLKKGEERADYITGIEIKDFSLIKHKLKIINEVSQNKSFNLSNGEKEYSKQLRKSPVYLKKLKIGEILTKDLIGFKRISDKTYDYMIGEIEEFLNKPIQKNVEEGTEIKKEDFFKEK